MLVARLSKRANNGQNMLQEKIPLLLFLASYRARSTGFPTLSLVSAKQPPYSIFEIAERRLE